MKKCTYEWTKWGLEYVCSDNTGGSNTADKKGNKGNKKPNEPDVNKMGFASLLGIGGLIALILMQKK